MLVAVLHIINDSRFIACQRDFVIVDPWTGTADIVEAPILSFLGNPFLYKLFLHAFAHHIVARFSFP